MSPLASRPIAQVMRTLVRLAETQLNLPVPVTAEERLDLREAHRLLILRERDRILDAIIESLADAPCAERSEARLTRMKRMAPHVLALLCEA